MGISQPGKTPNTTYYTHESYIDGRYGEKGYVYIVANDCASFSTFGAEHIFILMDNEEWAQYKVYEWTVHDLKMYACKSVKFRKKKYLGIYRVSDVYRAAKRASYGEEFNTITYNCKDWVKRVEKILNNIGSSYLW